MVTAYLESVPASRKIVCYNILILLVLGLSLVTDTHLQLWSASPEGESLRVDHSLCNDRDTLCSCECFHLSLCHMAPHFHPPSLPLSISVFLFIYSIFFLSVSFFPPPCLVLSLISYNLPAKLPVCYLFPTPLHLNKIGTDSFNNSSQFMCDKTDIHVLSRPG